jgi:BON domain
MFTPDPSTVLAIRSSAIDGQIADCVFQKLAQRGIHASPAAWVDVEAEVVTVRGRVRSYYERQLIAHTIRSTPGVRELRDLLEMAESDDRSWLCPSRPHRIRNTSTANAVAAGC